MSRQSHGDVMGEDKGLKESGVKVERMVTHGHAISVSLHARDGNRCEAYWNTGLKAKQPFGLKVDLDKPTAELMKDVEEAVRKYGKTGVVDRAAVSQHNLGTPPQK